VGVGTWQEIIHLSRFTGQPRRPPDVRVPSIMGLPRHTEIPGTRTATASPG
jgi:hypothetical protein